MKFYILLLSIMIGFVSNLYSQSPDKYIKAPYSLKVIKHKKAKKRFREFRADGKFLMLKVILVNNDSIARNVDYSCFYLNSKNNISINVNSILSVIKQTEFEDLTLRNDRRRGFADQIIPIQPQNYINGWLIFEIPYNDEYELIFRGYKNLTSTL